MTIFRAAFLAIVLSGAASAATVPVVVQASPLAPERSVVMVGEGSVKALPDTAIVSAGVVTRSRHAGDALRDNVTAMAKAVAALKASGLTDQQITTASVRFEPQFDRDSKGNFTPDQRIVGYTVSNRIIVTLKEKIERAGEIFDTLIQNGANDSAVVTFKIDDLEPLENQARAAAAKKALTAATAYAKALGVELGTVKLVHEGTAYQVVNEMISADDVGALPDKNVSEALQRIPGVAISRIEASEQTITRVVTITWGLK